MSELMQERYGTTSRRRRIVLIAATTGLAVVFLAWVAWAAWFHTNPAIDAAVTRFQITGDHQVLVQVDARFRDSGVRGACLLRATAQDHTVVGERNVDATTLRSHQGKWISVRTLSRATTVELVRCTETS